jgi:hypothetical protein
VTEHISVSPIGAKIAGVHLKVWPLRPIIVLVDPDNIVQSAGSQSTPIIWWFVLLSAVVMTLEVTSRRPLAVRD